MFSLIQQMLLMTRVKCHELFTKEEGEVNIVAIVVLIGVAVVLAIIFKDAIAGLITTLINSIKGNAEDAIKVET